MSIKRVVYVVAMLTVAAVAAAQAKTFNVTGEGGFSIWRAATGQKEAISGPAAVGIGDTLFTAADKDAVVQIEANSKLLVKSGSVVAFGGDAKTINATLEDGQVFLDRGKPHELASVRISAQGYTFTPTGTAAAVKTARGGAPTVAVLRGSMKMSSASGGEISVGAGQFGTVDNSGKTVSGQLNDKGLAQLESWTGVKAEAAPVQLAQAAVPQDADAAPSPVSDAQPETPSAPAPAAPTPTPAAPTPAPAAPPVAPVAAPAPAPVAPAAAPALADSDDKAEAPEQAAEAGEAKADDGKKAATPASKQSTPTFSKPEFEFSAGVTTIDGEPWTRMALGIDLPIWKFGVFLDLEFFIDNDGKLSDKGWDFKDDWADAVLRKIRYIRFGRENDPLFVKFGGLSNVTLGYGMIMDRFTNMLNYPEEKLLGLQFYLNDISNYGISLQTMLADFSEVGDSGGVYAARLAVKPLKATGLPIIRGLDIGGTYALDYNTHAPAKKWKSSSEVNFINDIRDEFGEDDPDVFDRIMKIYGDRMGIDVAGLLKTDSLEKDVRNSISSFSVWGLDASLPLINTSILGLTVYGQHATRADSVKGWAIGAPGVAFNVWKLSGNFEYRKIEGRFTPGFFDTYYLDERFSRGLLEEKSQYIDSVSLDGVFGRIGMDVYGFLKLDGSYQYMLGKNDAKDQRYEASAGLGKAIMDHIPKITNADVYIRNSNIGGSGNYKFDYDKETEEYTKSETGKKAGLFDPTPFMYWGYKLGFELTPGATLIWDYRYGWAREGDKLVPNNYMLLQTALRF